ncbi:13257_t:CDS:1 [Ambispora gerdemannii]|uniref:13257_t:CDS:1 n=1 Tax=Ambispora gerdemannii TaxID=144530 RepID=A0A9N9AHI8_9GLOM|nr:13257_t:CDS:1 [Ambispora gerdemannii]
MLQILEYIPSTDLSTIFSCLLINKHWCATTTVVLWRNPFRLLKTRRRRSAASVQDWRIRAAHLFESYISFLDNEARAQLKQVPIYLPANQSKKLMIQPSKSPQNIIINYVSFMDDSIDCNEILDAAHCWVLLLRTKMAAIETNREKVIYEGKLMPKLKSKIVSYPEGKLVESNDKSNHTSNSHIFNQNINHEQPQQLLQQRQKHETEQPELNNPVHPEPLISRVLCNFLARCNPLLSKLQCEFRDWQNREIVRKFEI